MYLSSILILRRIVCDLAHIYPNSSVFDDCRFLNNILSKTVYRRENKNILIKTSLGYKL